MDKHYLYLIIIIITFISVNFLLMSSFYLLNLNDKRNYLNFPKHELEKPAVSSSDNLKHILESKFKTTIKPSIKQTKQLKAKTLQYLDHFFAKIRAHYSYINRSVYKLIEEVIISNRTKLVSKNPWRIATEWLNNEQLLPIDSEKVGSVINYLKNAPVVYADIGYKGTQLKMTLTLRGMQRSIFKPKWYALGDIVNGSVYSGADRHNGEAVAFHLSRILGMNNVPIATTRKISLSKEILPVASAKLASTFLKKDSKTCFYGVCFYCNKENFVCDDGKVLDGAVILWLPTKVQLASLPHPWARIYNSNKSASWEINEDYCSTLISKPYYLQESSYRILQLVNVSIFDFLIQNGDRHHYNVLSGEENTPVVMLDNGKSFGDPYTDHLDILAPLLQCCVISRAVYNRLILLSGGGLSLALKEIFVENISLLSDAHFLAIDRRLSLILAAVRACRKVKGGWDNVFR